ncbi:MAG: peptide-methionine (S)-S-oxide reductase MsrA [Bacilli bacterium]|jgi:methionine-S-sulfoxide reductase
MINKIVLAGGCFWGIEAFFKQLDGVIDVVSGYANSLVKRPGYMEVKAQKTGAVEAVEITYDDSVVTLGKIFDYLFRIIDVTAVDHQGGDYGSQYRSGIYYQNEAEQELALVKIKQEQTRHSEKIALEVVPLDNFYLAEDYHQDYLAKNPDGYCHINLEQIDPKDKKLNKNKVYQDVLLMLDGLLSDSLPGLSMMANLTAMLKEAFPTFSWVGFYYKNDKELYLGPFQGKVACETIAFNRGVCGKSYRTNRPVIVEDVHAFVDHIACDSGSNSEIVLPLLNKNQEMIGVLDIDSYRYANFDKTDEFYLSKILSKLSVFLD